MKTCRKCGKREEEFHGLCKNCFKETMEKRIKKTIRKRIKPSSRIIVADNLTKKTAEKLIRFPVDIELREEIMKDMDNPFSPSFRKKIEKIGREECILLLPFPMEYRLNGFLHKIMGTGERSEEAGNNTASLFETLTEEELRDYAKATGHEFNIHMETDYLAFLENMNKKYGDIKHSLRKSMEEYENIIENNK